VVNTVLGQSILLGILVVGFLIFLYFFAASHEKSKRNEKRKYQSSVSYNQPQSKRLFKKDPQDPLLTFTYWVILPLFSAFVTVMLVLLAKSIF
jgi:amino acid transporter